MRESRRDLGGAFVAVLAVGITFGVIALAVIGAGAFIIQAVMSR